MSLKDTYKPSLALLTDLYQLTMAYGYWKSGMADDEAVFHLSFRKNPFGGGYSVACGLADVIDYVSNFKVDGSDVDFLLSRMGNNGLRMFDDVGFLDYLRNLELKLDVDAVPEGTVVFPHEPLVRVKGPLLACQLVETPLLNIVNFQTLIATKASRVCQAAQGDEVLEFGLRRAQGVDGSLSASRAAYIGGCSATSNALAGKMLGIPVKGTHAHSWVMSFPDERRAFEAYAEAMPNNCVFLVDTYDTIKGVRNAVEAGKRLRARGHEMCGIRLDSGDLAYLSREARKILDDGGFPEARIVASNDLDEHLIASLKSQGAKIDVWGVGTKMVTAYDQPALGGVYKLSAIRSKGEVLWRHKIKLSEQTAKTSIPGVLQVKRFSDKTGYVADAIYDTLTNVSETMDAGRTVMIVDPIDPNKRKFVDGSKHHSHDLLVPVFREGKQVYESPSIHDIRNGAMLHLRGFHPGVRRLVNPHEYPAGLEMDLNRKRRDMITEARGQIGFMTRGMETP